MIPMLHLVCNGGSAGCGRDDGGRDDHRDKRMSSGSNAVRQDFGSTMSDSSGVRTAAEVAFTASSLIVASSRMIG